MVLLRDRQSSLIMNDVSVILTVSLERSTIDGTFAAHANSHKLGSNENLYVGFI